MKFLLLIVLLCGKTLSFQPASRWPRQYVVHGLSIRPKTARREVAAQSTTTLHALRLPTFRRVAEKSPVTKDLSNKLSSIRRRVRQWARRAIFNTILFFVLNFATINPAFARSGGRMGGSFRQSPAPISRISPPRSSSYHSGPIRSYHRAQPRIIIHRGPHVHVHSHSQLVGETAVATRAYAGPVRRARMSDVVLVTAVGSIVALNVMDKLGEDGRRGNIESALGPGISVVSVTVALNVPDRDSPNSILARLSRLALSARTDTRKGVQDLITEATLELLRQKDAIVSADSTYSHFRKASDAQREFNILSIGGRSKYDEETVSNYSGGKQSNRAPYASVDAYPRATVAIVTINLCIEGDSTRISQIRNRIELESALTRIASDCQVDDCLLSAEVLWSPERRNERITSQEVYADYPTLLPL